MKKFSHRDLVKAGAPDFAAADTDPHLRDLRYRVAFRQEDGQHPSLVVQVIRKNDGFWRRLFPVHVVAQRSMPLWSLSADDLADDDLMVDLVTRYAQDAYAAALRSKHLDDIRRAGVNSEAD